MKVIKLTVCFVCILLASCTTEKSGSPTPAAEENTTLSGTWLVKTIITPYDKNTGEKLNAKTFISTYFFSENDTAITGYRCEDYITSPSKPFNLTRDNSQLKFTDINSDPLTIIEDNKVLSRTTEETFSSDRIVYEETYVKISNTINTTTGSLSLNGPVSTNSSTNVCLRQSTGENDNLFDYEITIPFDDDVIFLSMRTTQPLAIGTYQYDAFTLNNAPPLSNFDTASNASEFWNIIGSNCLCPNTANLEITTVETNLIEGIFSFIGQDSGSYNGRFSFTPY